MGIDLMSRAQHLITDKKPPEINDSGDAVEKQAEKDFENMDKFRRRMIETIREYEELIRKIRDPDERKVLQATLLTLRAQLAKLKAVQDAPVSEVKRL